MRDLSLSNEFIVITILIVSMFIAILALIMYFLKKKSNISVHDRYDTERKMVELEYMRNNLEMKLYDISKKLDENESRWRDINHLVINAQNKFEKSNYVTHEVQENDFLKNFGITNSADYTIKNSLVFVLTPFNNEYRQTFFTIRDACESLRLDCIRGDEEYIPDDIFPIILKKIVQSRLIIANITGRNSNVMYELGIAHAIGKPTIIISKNFTEIPFDLNNKRIIIFENEDDLFMKLKSSINDILINSDLKNYKQ